MELTYSVDAAPAVDAPARHRNTVVLLAGALDILVIIIAITAAVLIRFGNSGEQTVSGLGTTDYSVFSVALGLAWVIALHIGQAYRPEHFGGGTEEFRAVARATFGVFGALAIVSMMAKMDIGRGYLAIAFPLGLVLLLTERAIARRWLVSRRRAGRFCERALIIGTPVEVRYAAEAIARNPSAGYRTTLVSVIHSDDACFELADGTMVDNLGQIKDVAHLDGVVDTVIVAGQSAIAPRTLRRIGWQLEGTRIGLALASSMTDVAGPRIHRRAIEGLPLMSVESPTYSGFKFLVKRFLDIALSALAILLLSPVFLVIATLVFLEDRGPVLFRQVRVGANGELFRISKFRSMRVNAEALLGEKEFEGAGAPVWKLQNDPRVTKIGKFIRAYSLDELPQLIDVLIGHMSLVGPRPQQPSEVQAYEKHVRRRLNVKPGVTGPWQVSGRSNLSWEQTIQKDLYYVENWSLTGDLIIMLKTVRAVVAKDGAY